MKIDHSAYYHKNGIALEGYDVVAYFRERRAVKGNSTFACLWSRLMWKFSSEENLQLFSQNPEQYAPQYGGFCSFGVSSGYKASVRPEAFTIENGKLYFNFAKYVRKRWLEKRLQHIEIADQQWNNIKESARIKSHRIPVWWKYQFLMLFGKDIFE